MFFHSEWCWWSNCL